MGKGSRSFKECKFSGEEKLSKLEERRIISMHILTLLRVWGKLK